MLITNHKLTPLQLRELASLTERCFNADGGLPIIYHHLLSQKRSAQSNILFYDQEQLAGFLSVYFFYHDACEISILIAPDKRRQGIATQLLNAVMSVLQAKNVAKVIFSTSTTFEKEWFSEHGFTYQQSEYHMERISFETILIPAPQLVTRKAKLSDLNILCELNAACFPDSQADMCERFTSIINNSNYSILLAVLDDQIIGKAHLHRQADKTLFSDIAVFPAFQRKGLGSEVLSHCINEALNQGQIHLALDVETNNTHALNLYLRLGFKTTNIYEYWIISADKLKIALDLKIPVTLL